MSILIPLVLIQAAAATAPAGTTEVAVASSDDAKIVCKTVGTTGSRLGGKRMCASKAEWRRLNEESEKLARDVQDTHSKQPGNE